MKKPVSVNVTQDPDAPIAAEIMAKAIVRIADATKAMFNAGLKRDTIITLISAHSGVGKTTVGVILNNLEGMRENWCTR